MNTVMGVTRRVIKINIPKRQICTSDLSPAGTQSHPSAAEPGHLEKNTSD